MRAVYLQTYKQNQTIKKDLVAPDVDGVVQSKHPMEGKHGVHDVHVARDARIEWALSVWNTGRRMASRVPRRNVWSEPRAVRKDHLRTLGVQSKKCAEQ